MFLFFVWNWQQQQQSHRTALMYCAVVCTMQVKVARTNRQEAKSFLSVRAHYGWQWHTRRSRSGDGSRRPGRADKSSFEGKRERITRAPTSLHRNGTETRKDVGPFPIQMEIRLIFFSQPGSSVAVAVVVVGDEGTEQSIFPHFLFLIYSNFPSLHLFIYYYLKKKKKIKRKRESSFLASPS